MANCDKKVEHKSHRWFRYNSITDEEEVAYCDGTVTYVSYYRRCPRNDRHESHTWKQLSPKATEQLRKPNDEIAQLPVETNTFYCKGES